MQFRHFIVCKSKHEKQDVIMQLVNKPMHHSLFIYMSSTQ